MRVAASTYVSRIEIKGVVSVIDCSFIEEYSHYITIVQTAMTTERRNILQHLSQPDGAMPYMDDVMRYRCQLSPRDFVFVP